MLGIGEQIDLSYYDVFGSLKLVILNGHKLPTKQEVASSWEIGWTLLLI